MTMPSIIATIISCVFPPLYLNTKQSMALQLQAYNSREKPVTKALLHPPDGHSDARISVHLPLKSCRHMDKGGIRIGHLDRGYLPHPTRFERSYRTGASGGADKIAWVYALYRELGNELDKNYDYEQMLSTSIGSNGSSGSTPERISAILSFFVGHVREARELQPCRKSRIA
jgi:hypothetical protein